MASVKLTLSEKGFGGVKKGAATVISDKDGQPLTLRLVTLPNGFIGGQALLLTLDSIIPKYIKSYVNTSEEVFEIKVNHQQGVGTVTVRHFDCRTLDFSTYEAGLVLEKQGIRVMASHGMENSEKAEELLNGILFKAFSAVIDRAFTEEPNKIFYGKLAMDGGHIKLDYFKKNEVKV